MAQFDCSKCGSQGLEWKEGFGKKTGKKWTAWYCPDCKIMHGMDGRAWGDKGSIPKTHTAPLKTQNSGIVAPGLEAKIDRILEILKNNFPDPKNKLEVMPELEEGTPF